MSKLDDGNSSLRYRRSRPGTSWKRRSSAYCLRHSYLTAWIVSLSFLAMPDGPKTWSPDRFGPRGAANIVASPLTDSRALDSNPNGAQRLRRISCVELAKPGRVDRALAIMAMPPVGRGLGRICAVGAKGVSPYLYVNAEQAGGLLIFLIGACIAAGRGRVWLFRGFMFRGWSRVFPRSRLDRSCTLGSVAVDSYPVRLVGPAFMVFAAGACSRLFPLRSNCDLDEGRCSFSHEHFRLSRGGPIAQDYPIVVIAIAIGIVIAAKIVCSVMICASSGASPPIWRAST